MSFMEMKITYFKHSGDFIVPSQPFLGSSHNAPPHKLRDEPKDGYEED